jgi:hypothetical protein
MPVAGLRPRATDDAADLVVRNAKVHTGDSHLPQASALAVTDGVITAVGDDKDVAAEVGPATRVVDTLGRRAIPDATRVSSYNPWVALHRLAAPGPAWTGPVS